jgi:hypothetical protein
MCTVGPWEGWRRQLSKQAKDIVRSKNCPCNCGKLGGGIQLYSGEIYMYYMHDVRNIL